MTRKNNTTYTSRPFTPRVGATITLRANPVESSTDQTPIHITVTDTATQALNEMSFPDVIAEGHQTTSAFQVWWVMAHDRPWITTHSTDDALPCDDMLLERFNARHATTAVWAIRFELDRTERPRLLVPTGQRYGDDVGYTDSPAGSFGASADPGEAVDAVWIKRFCDEAADGFSQLRALSDEQRLMAARSLPPEQRMAVLRRFALERGVDIRDHKRLADRAMDAMERKIRAQRAQVRQAA